jgi:hypothetical protein
MSGQARVIHVKLGQAKTGSIRSHYVKPGKISLGQARLDRPDQVSLG